LLVAQRKDDARKHLRAALLDHPDTPLVALRDSVFR
jgi:hypothetical protein